jgi:predicted nucleic acid-binding Zn ribbon protein
VFGSWFDKEAMTDRQTEHYEGSCRQCGARYAFATNIVRGFADYVEAKCPKCGASLGEFREDVDVTIEVQLLNAHD